MGVIRTNIALDPETRSMAIRLAKRYGLSLSALVRMLIRREWEEVGGGEIE